ncbi:MAG: flagellar motor switch protein FliM [Candidatus Methylomirabilales bacterium]
MPQILTQEEIDSLLGAVSRGDLPRVPEPSARTRRTEAVLPYDFRRANRITKEQIRALQMLHDGFARGISSSLSAYLRTLVEVQLSSVEQLGYGEFMLSLAAPCSLGVFEMTPLKGGAILDLDPHLVFPMIDRILGGAGKASVEVRELTEIERALVSRVYRKILGDLQSAWQQLGRWEARLLNLETNPQFVMLASPNDTATLIGFDVRIGESTGVMNLCLPFALLEPILPKLTMQRWSGSAAQGERQVSADVEAHLRAAPLRLRAVLPPVTLSIARLSALKPGDVLPLRGWPDLPVTLEVEGTPCFRGRAGRRQRLRAVEITTPMVGGDRHA